MESILHPKAMGMDAGMEPAVHPKRYGLPLPSLPKRTEASVPVHPLWDGGGMACPRYGGGEVHPSSGWRCGSIPMAPSLWAGWTGGMDCSLLCCPRVVSYPVPVAQTPQGGGGTARPIIRFSFHHQLPTVGTSARKSVLGSNDFPSINLSGGRYISLRFEQESPGSGVLSFFHHRNPVRGAWA